MGGSAALLVAALDGPHYTWYKGTTGISLAAAVLTKAGLPPELADKPDAVCSYVVQKHVSEARGLTAPRRGTLVIVGYQGAGKTSLVWRLRNLGSSEPMPEPQSTDGIEFGTCIVCLRSSCKSVAVTVVCCCMDRVMDAKSTWRGGWRYEQHCEVAHH